MNETVPDEAFAALQENLGYVLQASALMCVIAPDSAHGETLVQDALQHAQAEAIVVPATTAGTLPALLTALYDKLTAAAPRPRRAAQLQDEIEEELTRRPRPAVVVHSAHLLRHDALYYLYRLWDLFQELEPRLPVVLVGPERLETVLDRPALASLKSCVYVWHRLTTS
ncbi:AAA family ATPase [Streptomyces monashensis]|uniref:AAA family ATPase n=1 Tax=Streptomyces monashensis TaxID=1678012 RepID=UPI0033E86728